MYQNEQIKQGIVTASPHNPESLVMAEPKNKLLVDSVAHITRLSALDTVRARIALAVEHGLLQPAERLPHDEDIADALDVSVTTARRALEKLAEEGLVVRRRGKAGGTFVSDAPLGHVVSAVSSYNADSTTINRLIDERALIETALVSGACAHPNKAHFDVLRQHIDEASQATDWAAYHRADALFHLGLVDASGMEWARDVHSEVLRQLYRYFLPYPIEYLQESNAEHRRMLDAMISGDTVRAAHECQSHIRILHSTMFIGLSKRGAHSPAGTGSLA